MTFHRACALLLTPNSTSIDLLFIQHTIHDFNHCNAYMRDIGMLIPTVILVIKKSCNAFNEIREFSVYNVCDSQDERRGISSILSAIFEELMTGICLSETRLLLSFAWFYCDTTVAVIGSPSVTLIVDFL